MQRPVFVVGSPRSGTTYFYHLLLSAGGFAIYHAEAHVFNTFVPRFGGLRRRSDREEFLREWLKSHYFERSGLAQDEIRGRVLDECHNGGDFLRILMESIATKQCVNRWAECTPENLLYVDEIKRSFPDALFIHVVRDGRDVALSMMRQGWVRTIPHTPGGALLAAGLYWEWIVQQGIANLQPYSRDVIEVRYEALVADRPKELARVGAFIGHDLDYDRILKNAVGSVRAPNSSFGKESQGQGFNPVGRWKSMCSDEELRTLETGIRRLLADLGYERSCDDAPGHASIDFARAAYRTKFASRTFLKRDTPLGRYFTDTSLLREMQPSPARQ